MIKEMRKGFTLIELLIVVAIIGILASVVLVGLSGTQRSGRDARRMSDLREIQTGLELYFQKEGTYVVGSDFAAMATELKNAGLGISVIPNDPVKDLSYTYDGGVTNYTLEAQLETDNKAAMEASTGVGGTCGTDKLYCVSNGLTGTGGGGVAAGKAAGEACSSNAECASNSCGSGVAGGSGTCR